MESSSEHPTPPPTPAGPHDGGEAPPPRPARTTAAKRRPPRPARTTAAKRRPARRRGATLSRRARRPRPLLVLVLVAALLVVVIAAVAVATHHTTGTGSFSGQVNAPGGGRHQRVTAWLTSTSRSLDTALAAHALDEVDCDWYTIGAGGAVSAGPENLALVADARAHGVQAFATVTNRPGSGGSFTSSIPRAILLTRQTATRDRRTRRAGRGQGLRRHRHRLGARAGRRAQRLQPLHSEPGGGAARPPPPALGGGLRQDLRARQLGLAEGLRLSRARRGRSTSSRS